MKGTHLSCPFKHIISIWRRNETVNLSQTHSAWQKFSGQFCRSCSKIRFDADQKKWVVTCNCSHYYYIPSNPQVRLVCRMEGSDLVRRSVWIKEIAYLNSSTKSGEVPQSSHSPKCPHGIAQHSPRWSKSLQMVELYLCNRKLDSWFLSEKSA